MGVIVWVILLLTAQMWRNELNLVFPKLINYFSFFFLLFLFMLMHIVYFQKLSNPHRIIWQWCKALHLQRLGEEADPSLRH